MCLKSDKRLRAIITLEQIKKKTITPSSSLTVLGIRLLILREKIELNERRSTKDLPILYFLNESNTYQMSSLFKYIDPDTIAEYNQIMFDLKMRYLEIIIDSFYRPDIGSR